MVEMCKRCIELSKELTHWKANYFLARITINYLYFLIF